MDALQIFYENNHSLIIPLTAFFTTISILIYLNQREKAWDKYNVRGETSWTFIGDLYNTLIKDRFKLEKERVKRYGKIYGARLHSKNRLFIADPEVIRQIAIKDFDLFTNHATSKFANKYQRDFLVWLQDDHWKRVRSMMTPTFTSGKIKTMFKSLDGCSEDLLAFFNEKFMNEDDKQQGVIIDLRDSFGMYTLDGISTCCYGLKLPRETALDGQKRVSRDSFIQSLKGIFRFSLLKITIMLIAPTNILQLINFELTPSKRFKPLISRIEKLLELSRNSPKKSDDLLQLLVDAKLGDRIDLAETDSLEDHHANLSPDTLIKDQENLIRSIESSKIIKSNRVQLTHHEILSEAAFMLAAGFDTTRTLLANCCYVLSFHQDIQHHLFEELKNICSYNDEIDKYEFQYDTLTGCVYLDAVISETLRLLPPAMHTDRVAKQDYTIEKYNVFVPKGQNLMFCIYSVHNDPDYWEQPDKFDPERFLPGNKDKIVPGSYMPFSIGPRHCIGMRFSLTEAKLGLAKTLMKFKLEPSPKAQWPPKTKPSAGLLELRNSFVTIKPRL